MKVISGTFEKGCGVIVEYCGDYYHKIVFEDPDGKPFVEIREKRFYENQEDDQEEKMMMNYEQFKEVVARDFMRYVPEKYKDYALEIRPVAKINELKDSLTLINPGKTGVSPTIYINDMYEEYMLTGDFETEDTLQYFAEILVDALESYEVSAVSINLDTAKDNIVFQLINTEQNKELLAEVPHRSFLDLSIVYRWIVKLPDDEDGSMQSTLIKNGLADQLGLTEEQLYNLAARNAARLLPPHVECISDEPGLDRETKQIASTHMMYIVTNKYHLNGAASVLYEQVLYDLAKRTGSSLYVFPSSIHEWIAMPAILVEQDLDYMSEMVHTINMTQLSLDERLSNHVYFYDLEERRLMLATDTVNNDLAS